MVIPLVFLLIALFFIPKIPQGIDLRGGVLITTQANGTIDTEALKAALESALNVKDVSVKVAPGATGASAVEVEMEQNQGIAAAETSMRHFYENYEEFIQADYEIASYSGTLTQGNLTDAERADFQKKLDAAIAVRAAAQDGMQQQRAIVENGTAAFGVRVNASANATGEELKNALAQAYSQGKEVYRERVVSVLHQHLSFTEFTYKEIGPSLSEFFLQKMIQVVLLSFVFTTVVVFLVFRSFVPSIAVIFGAVNDIVFALGAMGLFGIPMTLASLGALLMLIGFSLDTDMLLTIRIMKRTEGTARDRAYSAMKTGLLMTTTGFAAFSIILALAMVTQLQTYYQIAAVALCGLVGDVIATWCTNAVIVLWNFERKAAKKG